VSDELARHARRHVATEKIETVPIGADPDRFPVDREPQLRAELDIDPETTVVLFVGEFCDRKGIPEICDVLPEMDADGTQFVFVGHGGDREADLRAAVTESDHSARHVYTGITSVALRRWLAVADLLLLPSRAEGRPTVVYEAMASETAVLGSTVGGIPEQVVDGETGVLIPPRDAATLAAALADLVADRDRLRTLGANGRDRLTAKEWTWTGHARRVRALHESALA
jgi:glycosyltransferase involved in cell wall biosynthesis